MKKTKSTPTSLLMIILLTGFFSIMVFWFTQNQDSKTPQTADFIADDTNRSLLIATQNSPFKDSLSTAISEHYQENSIAVKIVDAKTLINIETSDFDAILLMYRWEANAPPYPIQLFMEENSAIENKTVVVTTSWNGLEKVENIDALTGASEEKDIPVFTKKIIQRLDGILKGKD